MKKITLLVFLLVLGLQTIAQDIYSSKSVAINFFSAATLEDISAETQNGSSVLNIAKNEFLFLVKIKSFTFKSSLMQEHFNENYMESDKFPDAKFVGKINETFDWKKDGSHNVTVTGKLSMHGEEIARTIPGTIIIKGNAITINTKFDIACKDYKIKIPSVMSEKIAEVVKVTVSGNFAPYVKVEKK